MKTLFALVVLAACAATSKTNPAPKNTWVWTAGADTLTLTRADISEFNHHDKSIEVAFTPDGAKKLSDFFSAHLGGYAVWEACQFRSAPLKVNTPISARNVSVAVPSGFTLACLK